jgi:hypothetical protein
MFFSTATEMAAYICMGREKQQQDRNGSCVYNDMVHEVINVSNQLYSLFSLKTRRIMLGQKQNSVVCLHLHAFIYGHVPAGCCTVASNGVVSLELNGSDRRGIYACVFLS